MNKPALVDTLHVVDALHAAELAHQAERRAEDAADRDTRQFVAKVALQLAETRADAITSVARAMQRAGQDLACWRPADATAAWNIAELLSDVQSAAKVDLAPAYRQRSSEADIAKGAAVERILAGDGQ